MESKPNSKSVKLAVGLAFALTAAAAVADSGGVKFDTTTLRAFPTNFFSANLTNLTAITFGPIGAGTEPIRVGTNVSRSIDSQVLVARTVASQPGAAATNSHTFSDSTVHSRTNAGYAANSFDVRPRFTNSYFMDHFAGFQFMPDLADGTMTNLYGAYLVPNVRSGTLRSNYGAYIGLANSGTVPANYGIRIATPTGNAPTIDYGVMVEARHASSSSFLDFWAAHDAGRYVIGANRDVIISRDRAYTAQLWVDAASGAAVDTELHGADAFGTDFAGGHLTLSAGRNTGAGAPGALIFSTSPYGSTGTASNNVVERMRIATNAVIIPATAGLRLLGNNIASNRVWTATNATTGEGEWRTVSGGSGTPGGSSGAIQFNQSGAFDGTNDFTYDRTNGNLTVPNVVQSTFGQFHTPNTSVILSADDTLFVLSDVFKSIYSTDPTVSLGGNDLPFASVAAHFAYSATNVVTNCVAVGDSAAAGKIVITSGVTNATGGITNSGIDLINSNPALVNLQMDSPRTRYRGFGWKTTATAASQEVGMDEYFKPSQGTTTPTGSLLWMPGTNGVLGNTAAMGLTLSGAVTFGSTITSGGAITSGGNVTASSGGILGWNTGASMASFSAGIYLQNSTGTDFSRLIFGRSFTVTNVSLMKVPGTNFLSVVDASSASNGWFGVGTTNNTARLTVDSTLTTNSLLSLRNQGVERAYVTTNGFVVSSATVYLPLTAVAGPSWVTNGMSAIWNSNGIATYIRSSTVGSATNLDTVLKVH